MSLEQTAGGEGMSLQEVWELLKRRRAAALLAFLATAVAAGLYVMLAKPVFEVKASFYVGSIDGQMIEPPPEVIARLRRSSRMGGSQKSTAFVAEVASDRREPRLITIKVRGASPKETFRLAEEVVGQVVAEHANRVKEARQLHERELEDARALVAAMGKIQDELTGQKAMRADAVATWARVYSSVELVNQKQRIRRLEALLRSSALLTEVTEAPVVPKAAVQPKQRLAFVLALVGGLFMALVAAFIAESWAGRRSA